ncbi:YbgA family protein [Halobacteriovorax sp.]|uniref:YbgA family protein n=1 Tax=Halobacteriovorax sp. TaxID=2020862 RepID=UPI0035640DEA
MQEESKPIIAISSCLLGKLVRYDKNHCQDKWILQELSKYVEIVPICPEMEMGLGVPREEIHLYFNKEDKTDIRLKNKYEGSDLTELAEETYKRMNTDLFTKNIDGFILTKKSPSCGLDNVKTIQKDDPSVVTRSVGLFAKNILENFPSTPTIDSGRLLNKSLRENFLKGVYAHYRFQTMEKTPGKFQEFHKKYKYILMDHSTINLKKLGKIVADAKKETINDSLNDYYTLFFETLSIEATPKTRCNTLQHLMGYFKKNLESHEKSEVLTLLDDYRDDIVNYDVLLKYFDLLTKKYDVPYLLTQYYFAPCPKGLKLLKEI